MPCDRRVHTLNSISHCSASYLHSAFSCNLFLGNSTLGTCSSHTWTILNMFTGNNEQTIWLVLHRQIFVFTYLKERDVSVCACVHDANLSPKCRGRRVGQKWINYFEMFLDSIAIGKEANLELTKMFLKQVAHNAMWGNLLNEVIMWAWYKHCIFCVSMACGSQLWAWAMHFLPFLHGEVLPGITIFASYK